MIRTKRFPIRVTRLFVAPLFLLILTSCVSKKPGPDQQFKGTATGAALGAGRGAVVGAQLSSGSGPGALVGAGFGAVLGGARGLVFDITEAELLKIGQELSEQERVSLAHTLLKEHLERRSRLFPTRDIFPADVFFDADEVKLSRSGQALVEEMALLQKPRLPWSRLVVVSYVKSNAETVQEQLYARHLGGKRSQAIVNGLVRHGVEPRRLVARTVLLPEPVAVDPADSPFRYYQALELFMEDLS
jgi:outer membrane protein OmpA-like peptidoglycan-associated protein